MAKPSAISSINRRERRRPELIGLPEAAERCGVHYRTFRRWIDQGHISAVRVGPKLLKVDAAELSAFLTGGDVA